MDFVSEYNPDILCLQETKMQEGQEEINIPGYNQYWHSAKRKGYSGTLTLSKEKPLSSFTGIGLSWSDDEGRNTVCEYEDFYLINLYVPNSKEKLARLDERMEFEDHLRNYLSKLSEKKSLIVCGDLNVAHKEIDLKNPKTNRKNAGFSDEEREKFTNLLDSGFIYTFRYFNPDLEGAYSWWSYRFNARANNAGWRIDYFLVTKDFEERLKKAEILSHIMGSDHCPVLLEVE